MSESTTPPEALTREAVDPRLKLIVFLSGACLMALEMAGVRILEPHFGSTIYVWGSIIGIFLGALSLGYWIGGALSDKSPRLPVLGFVILGAALWVAAIPWIAGPLCHALEDTPSRFRPLWAGLILYCAPSILLGIVSPFAVRLAARQVSDMGRVAGGLYALSTLGSIVGTFLVTFVLVEYIGTKAIILSVAGGLLVVSALCFSGKWNAKNVAASGVVVLLLAAGFWHLQDQMWRRDIRLRFTVENSGPDSGVRHPDKLLASAESTYHHITIIDSYGENYLGDYRRPARLMKFNNQTESGILLDDKGELLGGKIQTACGYTRRLHMGVIFTEKAPKRVLVIGCGGGIGPQAFLEDYQGTIERIDVVDIDPVVFDYAREFFNFPKKDSHKVIKAHVMDGREFVKRHTGEKWDYIIMDAYTTGGRIPKHLISREFFVEAKKKLAPGGIVLANVIGALGTDVGSATTANNGASRLYKSTFKAMQSVFGEGKMYTFPRRRRGKDAENIIIVAAPDCPSLLKADIRNRYLALAGKVIKQPRTGTDGLDSIIDNAKAVPPQLDGIPMLTDDFCPTDSMVAD